MRLVGSRKDYDHNHKGTLRFPHLSVDDMIHHLLSHGDIEDWLKVNQFFLEQMAYIAGGPDVIQEGERTALDNSILLLCSSMMSSHHDADQRLVVLVGGGSRQLKDGQVLNYRENKKSPDVSATSESYEQDGAGSGQLWRRKGTAP